VGASAALALALRVSCLPVLDARKAAAVSRPEPGKQFGRPPLPVIEVPTATTQPAPTSTHRQEVSPPLFVAGPRKDGRRPGQVRMTYRPFTGQRLKEGEHLATKEGRRYRRIKDGEAAAA
jgi:hypothetical protein